MKKLLLLLPFLIHFSAHSQTSVYHPFPHSIREKLNCSFDISLNSTPVICNGGSTGAAWVNASNGVSPYTYSWSTSPVQTSQTATGLSAGIYTCLVTDFSGCSVSTSIFITQPPPLFTSAGPDEFICGDSVTLNAQLLPGQAGVWFVVSGTGTFSDAGSPNSSITGLSFGNNILLWSVVDTNGCTASDNVIITAYFNIQATILSQDTEVCLGDTFNLSALNPAPGIGVWSICGIYGNPSGIANPSSYLTYYINAINGTNIILWTVMNGPCRSQDTVIYRDTCFVGIKEVSIASSFVNIFPNPLHSSSILQIINPSFFQAELKIYNVLGGEVKRQKIISQTPVISRDGIADGIYFFRIINEAGESAGGKFVIN